MGLCALGGYWHRSGTSPPEACQLTGHGHRDPRGGFAFCPEASGTFAPPALGLPAAGLDAVRRFFEAPVQLSAALGWGTIRPGAFHQSPSGMGLPGLGHGTLSAWPGTGGR
jgi:hypothetical protein